MWIVYGGLKHIDNKHIVFPVISWLLKLFLITYPNEHKDEIYNSNRKNLYK